MHWFTNSQWLHLFSNFIFATLDSYTFSFMHAHNFMQVLFCWMCFLRCSFYSVTLWHWSHFIWQLSFDGIHIFSQMHGNNFCSPNYLFKISQFCACIVLLNVLSHVLFLVFYLMALVTFELIIVIWWFNIESLCHSKDNLYNYWNSQ